MKSLLLPVLMLSLANPLRAASTAAATQAINSLGIDLLKKTSGPDANALLSPYSIQSALAMTYAGAAGNTREEMAKTLHFPMDGTELNASFAALNGELAETEKESANLVAGSDKHGGPSEPITLSVANRLYGQAGEEIRKPFLDTLREFYGAPLELLDFKTAAEKARGLINAWVENQTRKRIQDLIPENGVNATTRLVLVNAIYLKAAWADEFRKAATEPAPFHIGGKGAEPVPTMQNESHYGYAERDGFTAISLPYVGGRLQFLILLPNNANGLPALEAELSPAILEDCANLQPELVMLWLPKFKLEPPVMKLSEALKALGMNTAFDVPVGSADFDGIAPRTQSNYLYISEVFHKTFLSLDENGTEAAAATAVIMMAGAAMAPPPKVYEVHVDHPFLFAIQDRKSGACMFLGAVNNPR